MNEIGSQKVVTVKVRDRVTGKLKPKIGSDGKPETRVSQSEVWRVTRNTLGGTFCRDSRRRLVVGLVSLDQIVFRPQGTRQEVRANIADLYRVVLQRVAANEHLRRARERKEKIQARRAAERIARVDRRLRQAAQGDND